MSDNKKDDEALSFVKRWIKAFTRIFDKFGKKKISSNSEFVDAVLKDEVENAKSQEELAMIEEKRQLLVELCDDVDTYYKKKASADQAEDLDEWFEGEVRDFVKETIPDADEEDVEETKQMIAESMDKEIALRTSLLEGEFKDNESELKNVSPENDKQDE